MACCSGTIAREGVGRIVRRARYPVRASDMGARARAPAPGCTSTSGAPTALRSRRTSRSGGPGLARRQRRFGEMAGARRLSAGHRPVHDGPPGAHPGADRPPRGGRAAVGRPRRRQARPTTPSSSTPPTPSYAGDEDLRGRHIRGWLPDSGLPGRVRSVETSGAGDLVVVRWIGPDDRPPPGGARSTARSPSSGSGRLAPSELPPAGGARGGPSRSSPVATCPRRRRSTRSTRCGGPCGSSTSPSSTPASPSGRRPTRRSSGRRGRR